MAFIANRLGPVFRAAGHDHKFARFNVNVSSPQSHTHRPGNHQKKLVFLFMMMPIKLAFKFGQLNLRVVNVASNLGRPMIGKTRECFGEVHFC